MEADKTRPEWVPDDAGDAFTSKVMHGVKGGHDGLPGVRLQARGKKFTRRKALTLDDYITGIRAGDRTILARAITLIESNNFKHRKLAASLLKAIQPESGRAMRVGITGVPGAGKSNLIEALGVFLCKQGKKVAVLAVDPSSSQSGGSILGDKTRMEQLARQPLAFIRPSPSGGTLGGVARKSRETMYLCEAAGYDVILVETVGVGQSEITVRSMVDFFLLVQIAGAGDDLQGIKKGVIEIADAILVNKADGENKTRANAAKAEYNRVLHYLQPATPGWETKAYTASALKGDGIKALWDTVSAFFATVKASGVYESRRREQNVEWMRALIDEALKDLFFANPEISRLLGKLEEAVASDLQPAAAAVEELIEVFKTQLAKTES